MMLLACLVELGLVIGKGGRDISEKAAYSHIAGYGLYPSLRITSCNLCNYIYSSCYRHDCSQYSERDQEERIALVDRERI
jgi:hypothetical protein